MKIAGWTKIEHEQTGYAIQHYHKWKRDRDNAFLEIVDAKHYGYKDGYIAVLWAGGSSKPHGVAGELTLDKTYDKAIVFMKHNP